MGSLWDRVPQGHPQALLRGCLLLLEDLPAEPDARIADVDTGAMYQLAYVAFRLPAERAAQRTIDPLRSSLASEHEETVERGSAAR